MLYSLRKVMEVTQGERIKMLREEKKMTMAEVGRRIGVGRPTIYKYETGAITKIPDEKIEALAQLFGVSEQFLKGWSDKRDPDPIEMIGMPVPDGEKFVELYSMMSYKDRITLTEIYQRAYEKLKEEESEGSV